MQSAAISGIIASGDWVRARERIPNRTTVKAKRAGGRADGACRGVARQKAKRTCHIGRYVVHLYCLVVMLLVTRHAIYASDCESVFESGACKNRPAAATCMPSFRAAACLLNPPASTAASGSHPLSWSRHPNTRASLTSTVGVDDRRARGALVGCVSTVQGAPAGLESSPQQHRITAPGIGPILAFVILCYMHQHGALAPCMPSCFNPSSLDPAGTASAVPYQNQDSAKEIAKKNLYPKISRQKETRIKEMLAGVQSLKTAANYRSEASRLVLEYQTPSLRSQISGERAALVCA